MTAKLSVRVSGGLVEDLELLASAGWKASEAVRYALALLADAHRSAAEVGLVPDGRRIDVVAVTVRVEEALEGA